MSFFDLILWLLPIVCAALIRRSNDLIIDVILLSIFSLSVASLFLRLSAPDVAITEAAVGAAISTLFFLAALKNIGKLQAKSELNKLPAFIIMILFAVLMFGITAQMPEFGSANSPANHHVGKFYTENTLEQTGVPNAVTSVLASYRSYDTLGEAYVIFTAGIAVLLILPALKTREKPQ